jgi:lipoprotein
MIRKSMLLVMTAAVAACIAGCSKEDIEAAREAGTNAVSKVADKTIELSDEAKGVVDRTKEHIHERIVKMPEETTRQAAEILGAAGEGAKDASELLNEHAVSLQEGLEFRSKDREK